MKITGETVEEGLNAVAQMVFPFRALENQKQWMRRCMRKPKELSIRKFVAAVGRLNNSLPGFPNGKESDKFTPGVILERLDWSIPESW
jgi:ribosomal protein L16/L10AE